MFLFLKYIKCMHNIAKIERILKINCPIFCFAFIFYAFEKVMLFNAYPVIFQLYHGENKSIFNEMMMRAALY
jgi:hypothetical protein